MSHAALSFRRYATRGFTLIELLVVIALVAVLGTLAAPSLREFAANQALGSASNQLLNAAMLARNTAITRNQRVIVAPLDGTSWLSGWRVFVDKDGSGGFNTGDEELSTGGPLPDTVAINTSTVANCTPRAHFGYRPDGFLIFDGSTFQNGGIPLISAVTARDRCVVFVKSGRARVCGAGSDAC